jgi:hypothetical protein
MHCRLSFVSQLNAHPSRQSSPVVFDVQDARHRKSRESSSLSDHFRWSDLLSSAPNNIPQNGTNPTQLALLKLRCRPSPASAFYSGWQPVTETVDRARLMGFAAWGR